MTLRAEILAFVKELQDSLPDDHYALCHRSVEVIMDLVNDRDDLYEDLKWTRNALTQEKAKNKQP
jgi:hypothetical protein